MQLTEIHISKASLVILVLLITTCDKAPTPTGPEIDPLVGTWHGRFVSSVGGESPDDNLVLVVLAGGAGTVTGYYFYTIEGVLCIEQIYIEIEADINGGVAGYGSWYASVYTDPPLFFYDEAMIDGSLDANPGTGNGTITVGHGLYAMVLNWIVSKD